VVGEAKEPPSGRWAARIRGLAGIFTPASARAWPSR